MSINYDYTIKRTIDTKGTIVEFNPNEKISKDLPSIVYIEGPNSIGKSTLLHIIALGFFGLRKDTIIPSLREKMEDLLYSNHQNITFKVCLTNKDGTIKLIAEKKKLTNKDIDRYELRNGDNKPHDLSRENFEQKYELIYDIPFDPTKRLNSLIEEINNQQVRYGNKLGELRLFISDTISEIIKRDPDKLDKAKKRYEEFTKKKNDLGDVTPKLEEDLELLEKSMIFKFYHKYKSEYEKLKKELESLDRSIKRKTKKIDESTSKLSIVKRELHRKLFDIENFCTSILKNLRLVLNKNHYLFEMWDTIDIRSTVQNKEFPKKLEYSIEKSGECLSDLEINLEKDNKIQEIKMYSEIKNVLEKYKNFNIKLPGLDKSLTEFISELEKKISEGQSIINKIENIQEAKKLIKGLKEQKQFLEVNYISKLNELIEKIDENTQEVEEEIEEYVTSVEIEQKKKDLKAVKKEYEEYETKYNAARKPKPNEICEIGEGDLKKFVSYSEQQLLKYIKNEKGKIKQNKKEISKYDSHINILNEQIKELSMVKEHKYQPYKEQLNNLLSNIKDLESKLKKEFRNYLTTIKNKKTPRANIQINYNKTIFKYLGEIIGTVPHIDKKYKVESIDLINGIIFTKDKTQIRLSDMGTGQSQSAYLKSLLTKSENKIIIALFDEISSMDSESLKPIYEKMNELYKDGRLLAGIAVQRADEIQVKDLVF